VRAAPRPISSFLLFALFIITIIFEQHVNSEHNIMASAKAYKHMEKKEWKAVEDMLSKGSLRKADLEEHHVRR
jgi:hypothetical protein